MYKYSQIKKFEKQLIEIKCPHCNKKDTGIFAEEGSVCITSSRTRACEKCGGMYVIKQMATLVIDIEALGIL